jgi:hypothetical protein
MSVIHTPFGADHFAGPSVAELSASRSWLPTPHQIVPEEDSHREKMGLSTNRAKAETALGAAETIYKASSNP